MTSAYMSLETVMAQVQDSQTPHLKGTSRHKVPSQPGNYVQLIPARKGKSVSSDGKSLTIATTLQGRLHAQE